MDVVVERFKTDSGPLGQRVHQAQASQVARSRRVLFSDKEEVDADIYSGRESSMRWGIVAGDTLALTVVTLVTLLGTHWMGLSPTLWVIALLWFGFVALYALAGFYTRLVVHPAVELRDMMRISVFAVLGVFVGLRVGGVTATDIMVVLFGLLSVLIVPLARTFFRIVCARMKWWGIPVAVVSNNDSGRDIVEGLTRWPEVGLRPVAIFGGEERPIECKRSKGLVYGRFQEAALAAKHLGIRHAIVSLDQMFDVQQQNKVRQYVSIFKQVYVVNETDCQTPFWTALPAREGFGGVFVTNVQASRLTYRVVKRAIDVAVSVILSIILIPVLLIVAVLIRIDSPGPVLFKQPRMGRAGRIYLVYKLRTMFLDSEDKLADILANDDALHHEYRSFHKLADDPRITRVGSFLRRYSLDELPQLWNVIKGDMSLVGPRAYVPSEISDMVGLERVVLQVRPGITGLWQVSGRNELKFRTRVDLDGEYIRNATLWLDLYIILRTVPAVVTGHGAN